LLLFLWPPRKAFFVPNRWAPLATSVAFFWPHLRFLAGLVPLFPFFRVPSDDSRLAQHCKSSLLRGALPSFHAASLVPRLFFFFGTPLSAAAALFLFQAFLFKTFPFSKRFTVSFFFSPSMAGSPRSPENSTIFLRPSYPPYCKFPALIFRKFPLLVVCRQIRPVLSHFPFFHVRFFCSFFKGGPLRSMPDDPLFFFFRRLLRPPYFPCRLFSLKTPGSS